MIWRHPLSLSLLSSLSFCCLASAHAKADPQTALAAIYAARDTAFRNKDVVGALAGYSASVLIYDATGNPSNGTAGPREDLTKLFNSGIPWSTPKTTLDEFSADKTGKEATIKAVRHLTVTSKVVGLGVSQTTIVEEAVRDHWVSGAGGWRITQERRLTPATLYTLCSDAAAVPTSNKVVGKWAGYVPSATGVQALMTMRFRENGLEAETLVSPRQNISRESAYTADNGVLTETMTRGIENGQVLHIDGDVKTIRYRFDNGMLLLTLPNTTSELRFTRQPD